MEECPLYPQCGGCTFRTLSKEAYSEQKYASFKHILEHINQTPLTFGEPVFIADGTRRRASFTFSFIKKELRFGFNAEKSHDIIDCEKCLLLTERINRNLPKIRSLLKELCTEPYTIKKGKKSIRQGITGGEVFVSEADNGIDVLFKMAFAPELPHRLIISDYCASDSDIIRISWQKANETTPETILEKSRPIIENSGFPVYIPSGTFLQASKAGEQALSGLVMKYIGDNSGRVADLFCGIGTFSYPLCRNTNNKILAIDSSKELLEGFKQSVNRNQITNIKIEARNLFKYPLDEQEVSQFDIVVFDPPRAGAAAQTEKLAKSVRGPQKVIAVSCNPRTFVNDANTLIAGGYTLKEITMVDQFIYSGHTELVALFEKEKR